ncbi:MAG TPA: carbon-nitrogen family hydrolase [Blastocatellia bacterium]|nr:carbon-nitrogen family hydrolase [Blastocatellia bacterium]
MMNVIALQLDIVWEQKAANHAKVQSMIEKARPQPGTLLVLPEMFATGFSMNVAEIHDTDTQETQRFLAQIAKAHRLYLMAGVVTRTPEGRGRNEAVIYSPEGVEIGRYHKLHPFSIGGESAHYAAGDRLCVVEIERFRVAPMICYDLRFPEIFRAAVKLGANLYPVIASWPGLREEHWVTLLKARAIENQAYVIGVNRCGSDPKLKYPGRSMIIDPHGRIMVDAGREEVLIGAQLNLEELSSYRQDFPILPDLRSDFVRGPE